MRRHPDASSACGNLMTQLVRYLTLCFWDSGSLFLRQYIAANHIRSSLSHSLISSHYFASEYWHNKNFRSNPDSPSLSRKSFSTIYYPRHRAFFGENSELYFYFFHPFSLLFLPPSTTIITASCPYTASTPFFPLSYRQPAQS